MKAMLHYAMPCHAMPCRATPRHATPRHATQRHTTPCYVMPCHATPRHATPRHATPRHATPCHATPRHATPCHAMPCHAMPCHAMPLHTTHTYLVSMWTNCDASSWFCAVTPRQYWENWSREREPSWQRKKKQHLKKINMGNKDVDILELSPHNFKKNAESRNCHLPEYFFPLKKKNNLGNKEVSF